MGRFRGLDLTPREKTIAHQILNEIRDRLSFLKNVGVDYLTLDRSAGTLSGGESQRIRLASQIGAGLVGVMYILDEPSIGLHSRDTDNLIKVLKKLKELGNTVVVVEHDEFFAVGCKRKNHFKNWCDFFFVEGIVNSKVGCEILGNIIYSKIL